MSESTVPLFLKIKMINKISKMLSRMRLPKKFLNPSPKEKLNPLKIFKIKNAQSSSTSTSEFSPTLNFLKIEDPKNRKC